MSEPLEPDWVDIVREAIRAALVDLHTGLPGKILSFDPATQSASVQPLIKRVFIDPDDETGEVAHEIPPVDHVPIVYPGGGGWSLTWPLVAGDTVYMAFAERSLAGWLASDGSAPVDPREARRHALSDAVALATLRPRGRALAGLAFPGMRLGKDDGSAEVAFGDDGSVTVTGAVLKLGGVGAALGVARVGDPVLVTDPALLAWATAVGLNPLVGVPFTGAAGVSGVITAGSAKVLTE